MNRKQIVQNVVSGVALIACLIALHTDWKVSRTTRDVAYGQLEQALTAQQVERVVISDRQISAYLKAADPQGNRVWVANRVEPELAEQLARFKVPFAREHGSSSWLTRIAGMTPGFAGADLANLVNEVALLATRRGAEAVAMRDLVAAIERIVAGLEKKSRVLNPRERETVAYHEMGHALVAMSLPGIDPVQKVSVIPRGISALGYTIQRPTEDRFLMSREELQNRMAVLLGGRAAELLVFGAPSTGAVDDLCKATEMARAIVTGYGMDQRLGLVAYETEPQFFLPGEMAYGAERHYSEETAGAVA